MVEVYDASKKPKKPTPSGKKTKRASIKLIKEIIKPLGRESMFTSYAIFPSQVYFDMQEEGEEVVLFLRQHPIVNLGWILFSMFLVVLPSVFTFFPPYASLEARYQMVLVLGWFLVLFGFMLAKFMHWFYTILIATDERLIDVDLINLFYREISDTKIDRIQDINSIMSGSWQTLFNYGSVVVQTASESPEFVFQNVPRPDEIVKLIRQLIDLEEQEAIDGRVK